MKRMLMLVIVLIMCLSAVAVQADALNPEFKVQYYAYLPRFSTTGGTALKVIDTSGAVLPQNGTTPATTSLRVDSKGNVMTDNKLTKIYTTRTLKFVQYPGLRYIDQVSETNANYVLDQIWLSSNNGSSWYKKIDYTSGDYSFTNIAGQEDLANRVIAVSDNTVIRLVYAPNSSTYTHSAKFFDYDITDGSKSPVDSNLEGINSNSGWKGSGTKLGFGNQNTNNGIGLLTWNKNGKNYPNAGNNNGYQLCTFGLVTGLKDGLPVFANNLQYKDWFGPTKLTGKTEIKGWNLKFDRVGDTYTLAYVNNGTKNITNDLTKFSHPGSYTHIWTNNFWPMDSSSTWGASGHDIKWGNYDLRYQRLYKVGTSTGVLPWSDDGLDHNSYFGMTYTVDFTLSKDYVGPLDYTFFGDDDMWVFLEDKKTGKTTLVCDIGGVHSSVGEYVNLRDYLKNGTSGDYRLHFFYTERGASGSTCYMQFTLPSVNNVIPTAKYSTLKLEKVVKGAATQEAFDFTVDLEEVSGTAANNYAYTVYNKNNSVASNGIINGNKTVSLKDGQYALIPNLFVGTTYKVAEADTNPYYSPSAPYYSGTINEVGKTITVSYVNTAKQLVEITIPKTDSITHAPVNGAQFSLTHAANCCDYKGIAGATATSASGAVKFTGVLVGHTYSLTETKVPTGYDSAAAYKGTVTVSADGVVTVDGKAVASAAIENDPLFWPDAITVPVKKNVAATDVFAKADMQKFVFELYGCDENGNVTGAALASKSPDANGDLVFSGLDAFVFDDYADSDDTRYFLVREVGGTNLYIDYDVEHEYLFTATAALSDAPVNGKFVFTTNKTMKVRENGGAWQETSAAAAEFTNTDKASGFSFVKKNADTGAVLAGAVFTLTHDTGCEACNGNARELVFTATSDAEGKISFESVPAGHEYVLEETKAPAGYDISFAKRTVKVTDSNVLNFEDIAADGIANKPLYWPDDISVTVEKQVGEDDVYAKADMQKFVFELYACDESGNVTGAALASKSPDADGKVVFEGINEFLFDDYKDSKETRHFLIKEFRGSNPFIVYDSERAYLITASATLSQTATNSKPEGTPASAADEKLAANGAFALTASTTIKFRETPNDAWQIYGGNAVIFANSDCKRTGFEFTKVSSFNDRELNGAEFTLTHSASCGCGYTHQDIPAIIAEAVNGKVTLGYKVETQILTGHKYLLKETKAPNGFELMNGVTYTVLADADGNVTYTRNETSGGKPIAGDSMMTRGLYENRPDYLPLSIEIEARKLYNNEIPVNTGENYMFALFDEEITENNFGLLNTPSTLPTLKGTKGFIEYVYNDGEGKIKFTPITVEKAGTYTYWILEVPGTIADVKYDKTIYKVTVTVDETVNPDGSGTPVVEYTYEANGQACYTDGLPTFNNYFVPDTGDHSNILFWLMLLGCTGCVMAMMIRRRREN